MGDETALEEIDATGVGERIAAALRGARMAAIAAVGLCITLALLLALNDARLAARGVEASHLGERMSDLGGEILGLATAADSLVRRHGVSATTAWNAEASRTYSDLVRRLDVALATDIDLEGGAARRLDEVLRDARALLGRTQDALLVAALGFPEDATKWLSAREHVALRSSLRGEVRALSHAARSLGERRMARVVLYRKSAALAGAGLVFLVLLGAVHLLLRRSERAVSEAGRELARRAEFCGLTQLPNRSGFDAMLADRVSAGAPFALLTLDLDGFKPINDTHGHAAGDRVLVRVARRLARFFRGQSAGAPWSVARLGGDEFAAFVPLDTEAGPAAQGRRARAVAGDLRTVLTADVVLGEAVASFGASMGIACFPEHGTDADALHNAADLALQRAKASGTTSGKVGGTTGGTAGSNGMAGEDDSICLYDPAFDEERRAFNAQMAEVARALAAGEFEPHLQPIVNLADGSIASFEMLARWRRGDRTVGPGLFLSAIENAGLLDAMTLDLLGKVLDGAAAWSRPVPVSVNVAAAQLRSAPFIRSFCALIDRAAAMGVGIEVELLEESVFSDAAATRTGLDALRERGVHLAVDDFGVGYSNFAQLGRVAIDKIKIDRSFVMEIDDAAPAAVVRAALDISSAIGVRTVAEGIEDAGTAELLQAMGCTLGQGYHFARPMPVDEATALLAVEAHDARPARARRVGRRTIPLRRASA